MLRCPRGISNPSISPFWKDASLHRMTMKGPKGSDRRSDRCQALLAGTGSAGKEPHGVGQAFHGSRRCEEFNQYLRE